MHWVPLGRSLTFCASGLRILSHLCKAPSFTAIVLQRIKLPTFGGQVLDVCVTATRALWIPAQSCTHTQSSKGAPGVKWGKAPQGYQVGQPGLLQRLESGAMSTVQMHKQYRNTDISYQQSTPSVDLGIPAKLHFVLV